jgi:nucleoside-diphosphate-sugar epimerase
VDYPLIALTGANGWLGRRVAAMIARGLPEFGIGPLRVRLRCLLQPNEPSADLRGLGAEITAGDLRDREAVRVFLADAKGGLVIHTAGVIHPAWSTRDFDEINVEGTARLLSASIDAGVRRMVVMSSNSPFGANRHSEDRFDEASPYHPYMGYGRSKWRMEVLLRAAMGQAEAPEIAIVRAPWFYGPGQPPRQTLFFSMIRNGRFPLFGKGDNRRSMAYVDTLAQGMLACAAAPQARNQIYWMADERPYTVREIVETVKASLRDDFGMTVKDSNPVLPMQVASSARVTDRVLQSIGLYHQKIHVLGEMNLTIACDIGKAKRELGFKPLVELREGMRRSIAWCLSNGHVI